MLFEFYPLPPRKVPDCEVRPRKVPDCVVRGMNSEGEFKLVFFSGRFKAILHATKVTIKGRHAPTDVKKQKIYI